MMTTDETLDSRYLDWLYSHIGPAKNNRNPARSFWLLTELLHITRFTWSVANDDNRIEDGKDLRMEFLDIEAARRDRNWLGQDCSVLEMMIALSRRLEFEAGRTAYEWFWHLIENLDIRITDENFVGSEYGVSRALKRLVDRTYRRDGVGGLFPLKHPDEDQREVEIWYQMAAYLLENGYE
jgi:hypothetical protein